MELRKFTPEQLENVKHIMFGKQKQANVTNEAVIKLIANGLVSAYGNYCLDTEESTKNTIKRYVQDTVNDRFVDNDVVILLIVGEQSFNCIKSDGPKTVSVEQPNPESPKVLFRVYALGEVPEAEIESYGRLGAGPQFVSPAEVSTVPNASGEKNLTLYDYKARVESLVKEILPLVPDGVKSELSDPYQQCLCCAEYFYNL